MHLKAATLTTAIPAESYSIWKTLLYLDGGSGGSPWRYSVTTDQYVSSGDFHSVTEAEATAVMDKYTHETLILTPFVV